MLNRPLKLHDVGVEADSVLVEVLEGLHKRQKELPSKLFYDDRGSRLFHEITLQEEYYPTRTEMGIMREHIDEMAKRIGPRAMIIEYGSGTSEKSRILLDHVEDLAAYVPIDISREQLMRGAKAIAARYPAIDVIPIWADYNDEFDVPTGKKTVDRRVLYYPGSTIGNFHPRSAARFLERVARIEGPGGGLLIGVDLQKDPAVLHAAYNDAEGVTAEFNLNILHRLNREIGTDFDASRFRHRAIYNAPVGRIEMHLVSTEKQVVNIDGDVIRFEAGETIWTESSYKYTFESFTEIARNGGFAVDEMWTDERGYFGVLYLTVMPD